MSRKTPDGGVFSQRPGESNSQWAVRLHLDPWFEEATAHEIADFTGMSPQHVEAALRQWASSRNVRRIHHHAKAIAERIGWTHSEAALVHLALERYAQRFEGRKREPVTTLDEDIDRFFAQHMTSREALG